MPSAESLLAAVEEWREVSSKSDNTTLTVTHAAETGKRHYVTHLSLSCNGTPTAASSVLLKSGSTVVGQWDFAAAAWAPKCFTFPYPVRGGDGEAVSVVFPAPGASMQYTVVVGGFTRTSQ